MRTRLAPTLRRAAASGLVLGAAAAATVIAGPLSASPAAAATSACRTSQLVVWLNTDGNGAAGTIFYALNFTNIGNTCTLRGYPGVSAVSQNGRQLGAAAARQNVVKVRTITLQGTRGGDPVGDTTAQATVGITEAANFPPSACHATTASGLRVYAPNQSSASFVAFPFATCTLSGPHILKITAVRR